MAYLLDFAAILIIALSIFLGVKKGLVRALISMAGFLLALTLAGFLCKPMAGWIYGGSMQEKVIAAAETEIQKSGTDKVLENIDRIASELPVLGGASGKDWVDHDGRRADLNQALAKESAPTARRAAEIAEEKVLGPIAVTLLTILCFIILFILLNVAAWLFGIFAGKIFNLPVLKTFNKAGGGIFGAVRGLVLAVGFAVIASVVASGGSEWLSTADLNDSLFCKTILDLFARNGLLSQLMSLLP
ncbi:MAG: CvpA family protein [Oscillospiraceae bacterium]|nr:CvpA family protein [Oscillospiraceae bacterium]